MRLALLSAICFYNTTVLAQSRVVDDYVAKESPIAKAGLLANIGPSGSRSAGAKAGLAIASPSTTNPDYLFTWTRDSALVFKSIIDEFTGGRDPTLRPLIDSYLTSQKALQQVSNPSGNIITGGLGEPKFHINGTAFTGPWGRWTCTACYCPYWIPQAENTLCFLQSYWSPSGSFITANTGGGRTGKDANTVLASIHTFDSVAGCDAITFQPCSDKALSNLKVYVDSFRTIYGVNKDIPATVAVATGRYAEDVYFDGNPWYLTTAAVAEQLYDALIVWKRQGSLIVTKTSLAFFQQFSPSIRTGTFSSPSPTYTFLLNAIRTYADGFLAVNSKYTPQNGSLSEQFDRNTGFPLSAYDLTWSYASTLTAFGARKGVTPPAWGAKGLVVPAGICQKNTGPTVQVTFNVVAATELGENIYITGNLEALQNWSPDNALLLNANDYPTWNILLTLPANVVFEYKYIRKLNGVVTWELDPNNSQTTPGSGSLVINDSWR